MPAASGNLAILTLTVIAAAALEANRFVMQSGGYPAAGAAPFGVTRTGAGAAGEPMPVDILGTTIVEAGGAIAADDAVQVDATGRVVKLSTGKGVGRAMEAAAAAGAQIEILLLPSHGVAA